MRVSLPASWSWATAARLTFLAVATLVAAWYGSSAIGRIGRVDPPETAYTQALQKHAADELLKASGDFVQWAVAALAGITAVIVTTKVHRSTGYESAYTALGPSGALIITSLLAASQLRGRYANSTAFGDFSDVDNIALLLLRQQELLMGGIACAGVFVLWYLANIVAGRVQPFDIEKKS